LEQIVDQSPGVDDVFSDIADSNADSFENDQAIDFGGGLDDAGHQSVIEGPDRPVQRLKRVWDRFRQDNFFRRRRAGRTVGGLLSGREWRKTKEQDRQN
jgi:hypothetical protein